MLQTNRINLRAPEPEDLDILYKWENDVTLWKYGNTINPLSRFALREFISNCSDNIFDTKQLRMIIVNKENSEPMGAVDLYDFDPFHQRAGIGILVDPAFQRKGVAKETIELIKKYSFKWLQVHQLYAHIPEKNEASIALFASCGFTNAGTLHEWIRWNDSFEDIRVMQCFQTEKNQK